MKGRHEAAYQEWKRAFEAEYGRIVCDEAAARSAFAAGMGEGWADEPSHWRPYGPPDYCMHGRHRTEACPHCSQPACPSFTASKEGA